MLRDSRQDTLTSDSGGGSLELMLGRLVNKTAEMDKTMKKMDKQLEKKLKKKPKKTQNANDIGGNKIIVLRTHPGRYHGRIINIPTNNYAIFLQGRLNLQMANHLTSVIRFLS